MDKNAAAKQILSTVGKDNIAQLGNCYTRVRMTVNHPDQVDLVALKKIDGVIGVVDEGNSLQVVMGPGTAGDIVELMKQQTTIKTDANSLKAANAEKNNVWYKNALKKIANIFIPIIPAFVGCGLIVAIYETSLVYIPGLADSTTGKIMSTVAYSVFTILPIIVGYNTSREFGGSPIIGAVLASVLNTATLTGIKLLGVTFSAGRGGVISVLLIAYLATVLEKRLRKVIPDFLDMFVTPLLTIAIMTFLGILVLQPLGGFVSETMGNAVSFLIYKVPVLAGLAAGVYLPLVMTGMHHGLIAVNTQLISDFGVTYLLPVTCMAGASQVGAAFAVLLRTKNKRLKKTILNALPIGMLGIGEPLIWGVTVPLGKPFLASCLGGIVGGSVQALLKVASKVPELTGGIPLAFVTTKFPLYFVGLFAAYGAGFVFCNVLGWDDPIDDDELSVATATAGETPTTAVAGSTTIPSETGFVAPVSGKLEPLRAVHDDVFASGMVGEGFAIEPNGDQIVAPADGEIVSVADTKHAIMMKTDNGLEVLIHLGIDTVELAGKPFNIKVTVGQQVRRGDELGTIDRALIKSNGKSATVMMVITNKEAIQNFPTITEADVSCGAPVMTVSSI